MVSFLKRLATIVDECVKYGIGTWTVDGDTFCIYNRNTFISFIKPYDFNTFKKQLSLYDFKTEYSIGILFRHEKFTKTNYKEASIKNFKRKKNTERIKSVRTRRSTKQSLSTIPPPLSLLSPSTAGGLSPSPPISPSSFHVCHSLCNSRCGSPFSALDYSVIETLFENHDLGGKYIFVNSN